jgi:hypothetical protein
MVNENRKQNEMEFYKGIPFNIKEGEFPDYCIQCQTRIIKIIKKLPRTFKCKNGHIFNIAELREYLKRPQKDLFLEPR